MSPKSYELRETRQIGVYLLYEKYLRFSSMVDDLGSSFEGYLMMSCDLTT